jgi:hypothetical protein
MTYQERRSLVSLIGTLIIIAGYLAFISGQAQATGPSVETDLQFWATAILLLIPVYIVFQMIVIILFIIANTIATRRQESEASDEFDRLVDLKSTRNFYHTFMAGFVLAMLAAALGQPLATLFIVLLFGIFAASVMSYASELYYYRRGV